MLDNKFEEVQTSIYELLDELSLNVNIDTSNDTVSTNYENTIKSINQQLIKYKDYIKLLKRSLGNRKNKSIEHYQTKLNSFKAKLRHFQLVINESQFKQHHLIRIEQFNLTHQPPPPHAPPNQTLTEMKEQLFTERSSNLSTLPTSATINHQIATQNKQITQSLQTSRQLLSATILQSELNIDNLDQQTKDLSQLNERFIKFQDLLTNSKTIIRFIEKQDKSDRQRIYLSIGFFLLCCCWVVYRRILRRPVRLLVWTVLKMIGVFNWLVVTSGEEGGEEVSSVVETVGSLVESTVMTTLLVEEVISVISSTLSSMVKEESTTFVDVINRPTAIIEHIADEL